MNIKKKVYFRRVIIGNIRYYTYNLILPHELIVSIHIIELLFDVFLHTYI